MGKEDVIYTHSRTILGHKKEKKIMLFMTIWMDLNMM